MKFSFPKFSFKKSGGDKSGYIALLTKEDKGRVIYLESRNNALTVLGHEDFTYTNKWNNLEDDVDEALYKLESRLNLRFHDMILFVYSSFIDSHSRDLKREHLAKIKQVSKSLDLKPMGFIEGHEAVALATASHAIIIEFDTSSVVLFLYVGGKCVYSTKTDRAAAIGDRINSILMSLKDKYVLPARIVLYNSNELDVESSQLTTYAWSEELFAQKPQIDVLPAAKLEENLIAAFSRQLFPHASGAAVANVAPAAIASIPREQPHQEQTLGDAAAQTPRANGEAPSAAMAPDAPVQAQGVGSNDTPLSASTTAPASAASMGFMIGDLNGQDEQKEDDKMRSFDPEDREDVTHLNSTKKSLNIAYGLTVIRLFLGRLKGMKSVLTIGSGRRIPILIAVGVFVLLVAGLAAFEMFAHSATVKVRIPTNTLETSFTLSSSIKLETATTSSTFNQSTSVTSSKFVGDKAKGEVTIFNSDTSSDQSLEAGTSLSADDLSYILDESVQIASASGDASSITSSSTKAAVTAAEIGGEYNLEGGTKFEIDGASTSVLVGKNDEAISGGSKKKVTVVGEDDLETLRALILEDAQKYAKSEAKKKAGSSQKIVPELTDIKLSGTDYSAEVGDEVSELTLSAKATVTYSMLDDGAVLKEVKKKLSDKTSEKMQLLEEEFTYSISSVSDEDADIKVKAQIKEGTRVDQSSLKDVLKGASVQNAQEALRRKYGVLEVTVEQWPPLGFLPLPFDKKNISLELEYKD